MIIIETSEIQKSMNVFQREQNISNLSETCNRLHTPRSTSLRGGDSPTTARHRPPNAVKTSRLRIPLRLHATLNMDSTKSRKLMSRKRRRTTMNVGDRPRLLARNELRYLASVATRTRGWSTSDHIPMSSRSQSATEVWPDDHRGELRTGREKEIVER